jgi:NTP pyrophosphatase (non-canonical NTP hydrolase)
VLENRTQVSKDLACSRQQRFDVVRVVSIALEEVAEIAQAVDVGELEVAAENLVLAGRGGLLFHALHCFVGSAPFD